MGALVINSGGLGTYLVEDCNNASAAGVPALIDCDSFANFFAAACWGLCTDENVASAAGGLAPAQTLSITTPAAPGVPSSLTTIPDTTGQTAQDLANAAITATQAANAAANPPATPDQCSVYSADWPWPVTGLSCTQMILGAGILGLGLFILMRVK